MHFAFSSLLCYINLSSSWHRCMRHTSVPPPRSLSSVINAIVVNVMKLFPQTVQCYTDILTTLNEYNLV